MQIQTVRQTERHTRKAEEVEEMRRSASKIIISMGIPPRTLFYWQLSCLLIFLSLRFIRTVRFRFADAVDIRYLNHVWLGQRLRRAGERDPEFFV